MKLQLDQYDVMIIKFLGRVQPANSNRVAEGLRISWVTAEKHLKKLKVMGYVIEENNIWRLRFSK